MLRLARPPAPCRPRPLPASSSRSHRAHRAVALAPVRAAPIALTLVPTGDGSTAHLDGAACPLPAPIPLAEGLYELGREDPADVVLPIPTV
jgi:hypothetical protein